MTDDSQIANGDDLQLMIMESLADVPDDDLAQIFRIMFPEVPITKLEDETFKIDWDMEKTE